MSRRKTPVPQAKPRTAKRKPRDATKFDAVKGSFTALTHHQRRFLTAYSHTANLTAAASVARCCRQTHYLWLNDPNYAAAFEVVKEVAVEMLEGEARRRAMKGSDVLLIFLLKGHRPETYRDRHQLDVAAKLDHKVEPRETLTDAERLARIDALTRRINARRSSAADASGTDGA